MKRVFGMPAKSCWNVYEIDDVDDLVKNLKKIKLWWTRHANAKNNWHFRSIDLKQSQSLDVTSATIVEEFVSKIL